MLTIKIYTRFRSNSPNFLRISRREWGNHKLCDEQLSPYLDGDDWTKKASKDWVHVFMLISRWEEHMMQSIVFAAMCLEAFIYDYAAHNFTDTYVKKYLDKLDIISKWIIIPKISTGKDFPTDSKAFMDLQKLIKQRNNIVHSKSMIMPKGDSPQEDLKEIGPRLKKDCEKALYFGKTPPHEIVVEILQELRKLEGENDVSTQWWQLEDIEDEYDV